jgi:hypothetical protein
VLSTTARRLDLPNDASRMSVADPGIDDSVKDTRPGAQRGDLQLSDEFECLLNML